MEGLTERTLAAYVNARASMRRELDGWRSEAQLLFYLILACFLWFVAGLPFAIYGKEVAAGTPLAGVLAARLFGTVILLPFVMYALAAISRNISRIFGGTGTYMNARLALFWAFIAAMPAILALSIIGALSIILFGFSPGIVGVSVGLVQFCVILGFWSACLAEAEDFNNEARVLVFMLSPLMLGFLLHLTI